jgi:hypothetical protein
MTEMAKRKIQVKTHMLNLYCITPEHLRSVADQMEDDGIEHIEFDFDAGYNSVDITEFSTRLETDEEHQKRLEKDKQDEAKQKQKKAIADAKKKRRTIIEARKMGLTVSSVDPIRSDYDHVYWVPKGTLIEDWVVDKDGYVWYDECGLLGVQKVYGTAKKANEAFLLFRSYCI